MKKIREKQLEKKLHLRRIQPDRKVKKAIDYYNDSKTNKKITESKKFDMIGDWTSNYGSTGANLARQIFSHLDFSSLQQGLLVSKCWYHYLTNDYVLWRQMSMKTKPYLENLLLRYLFAESFVNFLLCKGSFVNYISIFSPIFDQVSILFSIG